MAAEADPPCRVTHLPATDEGVAMARPRTTVDITIRYDPAGNGWMTASIPSLPGTTSMGRTRAEARVNVLNALAARLAVAPDAAPVRRGREERLRLDLGLIRILDQGHGRAL